MLLSIRSEDIQQASERAFASAAGRQHSRYHPIAIALERVFAPTTTVVVTKDWIHVCDSRAGRGIRIPLRGSLKLFHEDWLAKECEPTSLVIAGL